MTCLRAAGQERGRDRWMFAAQPPCPLPVWFAANSVLKILRVIRVINSFNPKTQVKCLYQSPRATRAAPDPRRRSCFTKASVPKAGENIC